MVTAAQRGTVTGRYLDPTGAGLRGRVYFTPTPRFILLTGDTAGTVLGSTVVGTVTDGTLGPVELLGTDNPLTQPTAFTWEARFDLTTPDGRRVPREGFHFLVPVGETVDLTTVSPVSAAPGTVIIIDTDTARRAELAAARAESAATRAESAGGGTGGDTGDGTLPGAPGASAYEIAVQHGFTGTTEQWLRSLRGLPGDPSTVPGPSAYDLARADGYGGSLSQWLTTLRGAPSESAYELAAAAGYGGTETQWRASLKGEAGAPSTIAGPAGKSAYELAQAAGYGGTEAQWRASLKGEPGAASTVAGPAGKSAYELAQAAGYTGTEAEWRASLKGVKGDSVTGPQGPAGQVRIVRSGDDVSTSPAGTLLVRV